MNSIGHGARRLEPPPGSPKPHRVQFVFDGKPIPGFEGEPVAVALLAAGVRVFRTMPETGERRGGYCFVGRCADCLMIIDGQSGVRACITPVREGLDVRAQIGVGEATVGTNP